MFVNLLSQKERSVALLPCPTHNGIVGGRKREIPIQQHLPFKTHSHNESPGL
jgi:hypothetical protein